MKYLYLIALACTSLVSAIAGEEILQIGPDQGWKFIHSEETALESNVDEGGLVLKIEPAAPPGITFVEAQVPWQWEAPKNGMIEVELRGEIKKNCYFAIQLKTNEGMVYGTIFGESGTGFPMAVEGSTAHAPLASFKSKSGESLDAGSQVLGASLIFAPDTANTITVSKISMIPEAK